MTYHPNDAEIAAAAKVIDTELRFHGHFEGLPTYEEMVNSNETIGVSEFSGMIERMLIAANTVRTSVDTTD